MNCSEESLHQQSQRLQVLNKKMSDILGTPLRENIEKSPIVQEGDTFEKERGIIAWEAARKSAGGALASEDSC